MDDLLARIVQRDVGAFELLYRATFPLVFRSVLGLLQDHALSEEVTQEVFLEVWCTAERFHRHRGTAQSWVLTIARHRAIDRVRNSQATRRRDDDAARNDRGNTAPDPADETQRRLEHSDLWAVLNSMADTERTLLLHYGNGTPYRELAAMMNVPLGTAKSRVRLALAKLRRTWNVTHPAGEAVEVAQVAPPG